MPAALPATTPFDRASVPSTGARPLSSDDARAAVDDAGVTRGGRALGDGGLTSEAVHTELHLLDRWAQCLLARTLDQLGALPPGVSRTATEVADQIAAPRHAAVPARWLRSLAAAGLAVHEPRADVWRLVRRPTAAEVDQAWHAAAGARHLCGPALRDFYAACAARLPELLRDELTVQALLFDDPRVVEELYAGNAASRWTNAAAAEIVADLVGPTSTVLEIGAGTGATTGPVLDRLDPRVSYTVTDVGRLFLDAARDRWAGRPATRVARFDLHESVQLQPDAVPAPVDVVLAGNVLHNGRDAGATLRRIRDALRPGGHLVLIETGRDHRPLLLSMHLLMSPSAADPGARPTDQRRHDGRVLLRLDEWVTAARAAGFTPVSAAPAPDHPLAAIAQFVLVARRNPDQSAHEESA